MFVIAVYDISTETPGGKKRLPKVMKTFRKYLHHSQKSVFEGEITEAKLLALEKEIEKLIDKTSDSVVYFKIGNVKNIERITSGKFFDPNANII